MENVFDVYVRFGGQTYRNLYLFTSSSVKIRPRSMTVNGKKTLTMAAILKRDENKKSLDIHRSPFVPSMLVLIVMTICKVYSLLKFNIESRS